MMPHAVNSNQALYIWIRDFLQNIYADENINNSYIKTLAMMITGMLLGPYAQLFAMAMCACDDQIAQYCPSFRAIRDR